LGYNKCLDNKWYCFYSNIKRYNLWLNIRQIDSEIIPINKSINIKLETAINNKLIKHNKINSDNKIFLNSEFKIEKLEWNIAFIYKNKNIIRYRIKR